MLDSEQGLFLTCRWRGYFGLEKLGVGYKWDCVNHASMFYFKLNYGQCPALLCNGLFVENYVKPGTDGLVHTNRIEVDIRLSLSTNCDGDVVL